MYDRVIKGITDLLLSGIAWLVVSPIYLILAIYVRLNLGSSMLFS